MLSVHCHSIWHVPAAITSAFIEAAIKIKFLYGIAGIGATAAEGLLSVVFG